jgi:hypothetical protein
MSTGRIIKLASVRRHGAFSGNGIASGPPTPFAIHRSRRALLAGGR